MAIAATLIEISADRRGAMPAPGERDDAVGDPAGAPHAVLVHDLSSEGLRLETALALAPGMRLRIGLPGIGARAVRLLWRDGALYDCRFAEPVPAELLEQALAGSSAMRAAPGQPPRADMPEPDVRKWHPAVRIGLMLVSAAATWTAILRLIGA